MTTITSSTEVEIPANQPEIGSTPVSPPVVATPPATTPTTPTSYSRFPGVLVTDPVTKTNTVAKPKRFMETKSYVAKSPIAGLGCFAKKDIDAGEFIEEVSAILMDTTTKQNKDYVVTDYMFTWPCEAQDQICAEHGPTYFFPTGNAVLYNHSDTPNCYWIYDKSMKRLFLSALRDIKENEELTWYYGHGYAQRLRTKNTPGGTANSGGCSSCQQRKNERDAAAAAAASGVSIPKELPFHTQEQLMANPSLLNQKNKSFYNRSNMFNSTTYNKFAENIVDNSNKETLAPEFRSMVVPEKKINDTIQDGTV